MKAIVLVAILCLFAVTFAQTQKPFKFFKKACGGEGQPKCRPANPNRYAGFLDFYRRQTLPCSPQNPTRCKRASGKPVVKPRPSRYSGWLNFYNRQKTGRPTKRGSKQGSRRGSRRGSRLAIRKIEN